MLRFANLQRGGVPAKTRRLLASSGSQKRLLKMAAVATATDAVTLINNLNDAYEKVGSLVTT